MKTKTIVFGGSGFLGSHVADELSSRGHKVTIFDLKRSPYLAKGQNMIVGDIMEPRKVLDAVSGCDYVYNFAGISDLDDARTKSLDTVRLNVMGNLNILEAAAKAKAKRFIYASSIYVYSQKGGFYRCSKQSSELYIEEYGRRYGLDYTILRYGSLYGSRANEKNSVYRYLKQAKEKGCVFCSGSGNEIREYINVRDAARLSVDILKDEFRDKHIIIAGHHPMKFKDMVSILREILGKDVKIKFSEKINNDHYDYAPYSFTPKIGQKLVNHLYVDMGQGILECLYEMYGK
ncbi:NAD(P)-dependent oxidoreductase [bacterium]|nr:MAG: NAD(P)-dependent oxidoreductase [bacterium]